METFIFELRMLNTKKKMNSFDSRILYSRFDPCSSGGFTEFTTSRGANRGVHVILIMSNYRKCMGKSRFCEN